MKNGGTPQDPSDEINIGRVYKGSASCELHSDSKSIENELLAQDSKLDKGFKEGEQSL
jgi:hypothetical protein